MILTIYEFDFSPFSFYLLVVKLGKNLVAKLSNLHPRASMVNAHFQFFIKVIESINQDIIKIYKKKIKEVELLNKK